MPTFLSTREMSECQMHNFIVRLKKIYLIFLDYNMRTLSLFYT